MDATGARVITGMIHGHERRGTTVLVNGIQERHLRLATRVGVISSLRLQKHLIEDRDAASNHNGSQVRIRS